MKHLTVSQLSEPLQESIRSLSSEQILITEDGKPIALLLSLGDTNIPMADLETWSLKVSPAFWQMIDDRLSSNVSTQLMLRNNNPFPAKNGSNHDGFFDPFECVYFLCPPG